MPILRSRTNWVRAPGPVADGLRIGLLGGSFNPAHDGHLHASALALKKLGLDYVWWLVSPQNPLKDRRGMADFGRRLGAAKAFTRHPHIIVTGLEEQLGTRFTIDTLAALKQRFPQLVFVWVMGSDNLLQLPRWRRWQDIFASVPIAVVARPGTAIAARSSRAAARFKSAYVSPGPGLFAKAPPVWTILDANRSALSATSLRRSAGA